MPRDIVTNSEFYAPETAVIPPVTLPGSAWGWSAWVEIEASTAEAWVLLGLINNQASAGFLASLQGEVQVGVGAGGAESPIATFPFSQNGDFNSITPTDSGIITHIGIDAIPAASRVSVRVRVHNTSALATLGFGIRYYKKPIGGQLQVTTNVPKVDSPGTNFKSVSTGSAWVYSGWVELEAAISTDRIMLGFANSGVTQEYEIEFGVGAGGAEVAVTRHRNHMYVGDRASNYFPFPNPVDAFPAGSRISFRMASSASITLYLKTCYLEKPL
jgi:hypothetical protein